jgi:hypothetical protein
VSLQYLFPFSPLKATIQPATTQENYRRLRSQQTKWRGMLMLRWRMGQFASPGALGKPLVLAIRCHDWADILARVLGTSCTTALLEQAHYCTQLMKWWVIRRGKRNKGDVQWGPRACVQVPCMVTVVGSIPTWTTATDLSSLAMTLFLWVMCLLTKMLKLCTRDHGMHGDWQFSRQGLAAWRYVHVSRPTGYCCPWPLFLSLPFCLLLNRR